MKDKHLVFDLSGVSSSKCPGLDHISPEFANAVIEFNNQCTADRIANELKHHAKIMWLIGFALGVSVGLTIATLWLLS